MRKENVVNKIKCFPGRFLSGVCRLYGRLVNKETTLLYQQRISGRSRIKCKMTPNFMSGLHLTYKQHGGFTPALVIPQCRSAGYSAGYKSGFTLIELLVVVLIIGILAAVALPQYQFAVMKSKFATLKAITKSFNEAEKVYYLANGKYTNKISELDIEFGEIPDQGDSRRIFPWGECSSHVDTSGSEDTYVKCTNTQISMFYQIYANGQRLCVYRGTDENAVQNKVCRQETNRGYLDHHGTYYVWYYQK